MQKNVVSLFLIIGMVMLISSKWFSNPVNNILFFSGLCIALFSFVIYQKSIPKENKNEVILIWLGLTTFILSDRIHDDYKVITFILGLLAFLFSFVLRYRRVGSIEHLF